MFHSYLPFYLDLFLNGTYLFFLNIENQTDGIGDVGNDCAIFYTQLDLKIEQGNVGNPDIREDDLGT